LALVLMTQQQHQMQAAGVAKASHSWPLSVVALASKLVSPWPDLQAFASQLFFACPVASCCGNPGCLTISSLSEWQMLNGKLCRRAGCKVARFCSQPCLKQMWLREHHKPVCNRL
jgi:hypothetical protein